MAPQVEPAEYGPSDLNQPGDKRPMWFDGSSNGSESFSFSQVEFSPPPSSSPTDTTSVLKRILSISRPAPNLFYSDNDYDAAGIYVTRRGATVIYAPLQNYPNGACSLLTSATCNARSDCDAFPIEHCNNGSTDTIYQIKHYLNIGFDQDFIVTNANDSGSGSLRMALAVVPPGTKIIIADNLDAETICLESELVISNDVEIDASGLENGITLERSGGGFFRIFEIQAGTTVTMDNLTITKGYASGPLLEDDYGGGILNHGNLTLNNCRVHQNQSDSSGGGIASWQFSSLVLNNTEVSSNSSAFSGAGIFSLGNSLSLSYSSIKQNNSFSASQRYGGGLYFKKDPFIGVPGVGLTISGSTVSGNRATQSGGGIYYVDSDAGLIENTTIANNATEGSTGAGTWSQGVTTATALTLRHATAAGNTVDPAAGALAGGGVVSYPPSALTLENSLVADNTSLIGNSNLFGEDVTTLGANLVEGGIDGILQSGPLPLTSDPQLTPLADNGGLIQTVLPQATSPTVDAAIGTATSIDQRGLPRPLGAASDLGAVELGKVEISVEQSGVVQADGMTSVSFDTVASGGSSVRSFSIRNASTGNQHLTGLAVTIDGPDATAFSVSQPALTDLAAESRTSLEVIFTPSSAEMHSAEIHVASNGEAPGADQLSYASAIGVCSVSQQLCSLDSACPMVGEACNLGESLQTVIVVARTLSFRFLDGLWGSTPDVGLRRADASNWVHGSNGNDFSFGGSLLVNREAVSPSSNNNLSPLGAPEIIVATRGSSARFAQTQIGDYFRVGTNTPRPWHGDVA